MNDLISRSELIKAIQLYMKKPSLGETLSVTEISIGELASILNDLPISFDLDKVIEQLKEEGCIIDDAAGNRAVEIIKKGGIS